jgi:hypothetical protein
MIPELRRAFNTRFSADAYQAFLRQLNSRCGTEIHFRVSETPCFFAPALLNMMARYGEELVHQLLNDPLYMEASNASVPAEFDIPRQDKTPLFVSVDFGLVRGQEGELEPKLVELQAFPTLYAYQPALARQYVESFGLPSRLSPFFGSLDESSYSRLLREAILGGHDPENVVLLEIDPLEQKTLPDFLLTEKMCGIATVNLRDVLKRANKLFHLRNGEEIPIKRIYNRMIVDELLRKKIKPPFDYRDDLDVEWAGHPNWYFRISKFSIPYLQHRCVPKTWFLDELTEVPEDREDYLLKPLYSFAGAGIVFAPSDELLNSIRTKERHNYILQERMQFEPVIETPHGLTQAEVRIMYIWLPNGKMQPVVPLVRMGRGKMMGVDYNRNLEWVGGSAALFANE